MYLYAIHTNTLCLYLAGGIFFFLRFTTALPFTTALVCLDQAGPNKLFPSLRDVLAVSAVENV